MLPGGSLYDLASAMFPGRRIMLHEHFRCVEPIIRFSMQFYNETIFPLRIPKASERLDPPLIDVYLPHGRKNRSQINIAEADAIVDEIEKLVDDAAYEGRSMGVVSLIGPKQAHYIQTLLLNRIGEEAYVKHDIKCGNPATFQGKECDIMFVSMVECPETQSARTALLWEQRFNVAFSRARDRMYLFRSVDGDKLKPDDLKSKVIRHFKSPMETAVPIVEDLLELCDSDFERAVFPRIRGLGYQVTPQVKVARYSIDMVVEGENDRRLAVELDGDKYHTPEQWAEDLVRQRNLERMGWRFGRCWGSSYYLDPDACIDDLVRTLDSMGIKPLSGEARVNVYTEHRVLDATEPEFMEPEAVAASEQSYIPVSATLAPGPDQFGRAIPQNTRATPSASDFVEIGDRVLISYTDEPGRQHTIRVSDTEHDPDMQIIRVGHPLADALLGATVDEEIDIPAGGHIRTITVIEIEKDASNFDPGGSVTETPRIGGRSALANNIPAAEGIDGLGSVGSPDARRESATVPASEPIAALSPTPESQAVKSAPTQRRFDEKSSEPFGVPGDGSEAPAQNGHTHLLPYHAWRTRTLPDPRNESINDLAQQLIDIIEVEGPVVLDRIFHIHAAGAGIKRIGNQLRPIYLRASEIALSSGRLDVEVPLDEKRLRGESVVRLIGCQAVVPRKRGPRTFEEIPDSEISSVMRPLLDRQPKIDEETLFRQVLDAYELKRLTSNVRNRLARLVSEEVPN